MAAEPDAISYCGWQQRSPVIFYCDRWRKLLAVLVAAEVPLSPLMAAEVLLSPSMAAEVAAEVLLSPSMAAEVAPSPFVAAEASFSVIGD